MRVCALRLVLLAVLLPEGSSNLPPQGKSLEHIVKCMQHDLAARLKLVYLATPKTASRHMTKFLNQIYNITRANPECKEVRPPSHCAACYCAVAGPVCMTRSIPAFICTVTTGHSERQ